MTLRRPPPHLLPCLVGALALAVSCGSSHGDTTSLGAAARQGRSLMSEQGCANCHGADFTGALGPSLRQLAGSRVTLSDGTTVTADRAYLTESIVEPQAKMVKGYTVQMPSFAGLTDEQVADIVAFLESMASPTGSTASSAPATNSAPTTKAP